MSYSESRISEIAVSEKQREDERDEEDISSGKQREGIGIYEGIL